MSLTGSTGWCVIVGAALDHHMVRRRLFPGGHMRNRWHLTVGLILAVCLAQAGAGEKEKAYCGVCWLLFYDKGISEELKLSPKELAKAQQVANEITDKYQEKLDKTRREAKGDKKAYKTYHATLQ